MQLRRVQGWYFTLYFQAKCLECTRRQGRCCARVSDSARSAWPRCGRGALFQLFAEASLPAERVRHNRPAAATVGPYGISQRPRAGRDKRHRHSSATWASCQQQSVRGRSRALPAASILPRPHQRSLMLQKHSVTCARCSAYPMQMCGCARVSSGASLTAHAQTFKLPAFSASGHSTTRSMPPAPPQSNPLLMASVATAGGSDDAAGRKLSAAAGTYARDVSLLQQQLLVQRVLHAAAAVQGDRGHSGRAQEGGSALT